MRPPAAERDMAAALEARGWRCIPPRAHLELEPWLSDVRGATRAWAGTTALAAVIRPAHVDENGRETVHARADRTGRYWTFTVRLWGARRGGAHHGALFGASLEEAQAAADAALMKLLGRERARLSRLCEERGPAVGPVGPAAVESTEAGDAGKE